MAQVSDGACQGPIDHHAHLDVCRDGMQAPAAAEWLAGRGWRLHGLAACSTEERKWGVSSLILVSSSPSPTHLSTWASTTGAASLSASPVTGWLQLTVSPDEQLSTSAVSVCLPCSTPGCASGSMMYTVRWAAALALAVASGGFSSTWQGDATGQPLPHRGIAAIGCGRTRMCSTDAGASVTAATPSLLSSTTRSLKDAMSNLPLG